MCRACSEQRMIFNKFPCGRSVSSVWYSGLDFDFNQGDNMLLSSFWQQNTNDAGERLMPQTCQILIGEWKKFFIEVASLILK